MPAVRTIAARREPRLPVLVARRRHRQERAVPDEAERGRHTAVMFLTKKHLSRRTFLKGTGVTPGAAAARVDGAGGHRAGRDRRGAEDAARLHLHPARRDDGQVDAEGRGHGVRVLGDAAAARAVPRSRQRDQRSRARAGRAVDRRGHRRRREPRPRGGGVSERRASGQEERSARRHDHRSDRRAAGRPGHAAAVDRDVDGAAQPDLRRRGLHVRLPEHAVVEVGDAAAADGEQPADRVRAAVRRRQHRRAAAGAAPAVAQPARFDRAAGSVAREGSAGRRPPPPARLPRRGARDRAPRQAGGRPALTQRSICPTRPSAFPPRSRIISS